MARGRPSTRGARISRRGERAGGSGSSRDAAGWERARSLLADAVEPGQTFFDAGCANGLLMESMALWAGVEPYGLDISPELAALAKSRLPSEENALEAEVAGWGSRISGRTSRDHSHPRLGYKAFWIDSG